MASVSTLIAMADMPRMRSELIFLDFITISGMVIALKITVIHLHCAEVKEQRFDYF